MKRKVAMKKSIFITLPITTLMLVACAYNRNTEATKSDESFNNKMDAEILRFPEKGEDILRLSYFADTVLYIPLETTTKSFIKRLEQVWMDDSIILINNRSNLLMFLRNGKFIRQIGKQGKGPGEYGRIFNFDVICDTIYLSSTGRKSLIKYSFDGTFCEEIQIKGQPVYFGSTIEGRFIWYYREKGKIYCYNEDFSMIDTIKVEYGVTEGRYKYTYFDPFVTYFRKTTSDLLFNDYLNDTIWSITNKKKKPAFILDMKDKLLPRDKQIEFCEGDLKRWRRVAKTYQMVQFIFKIGLPKK